MAIGNAYSTSCVLGQHVARVIVCFHIALILVKTAEVVVSVKQRLLGIWISPKGSAQRDQVGK